MKQWISFFDKKDKSSLGKISLEGYFTGEIQATMELIAEEKKIDIKQIGVEVI